MSPTGWEIDVKAVQQELDDIANPSATDDKGNVRVTSDPVKIVVKLTRGDACLTSIDQREENGRFLTTVSINSTKIRSVDEFKAVMTRLGKAMMEQ